MKYPTNFSSLGSVKMDEATFEVNLAVVVVRVVPYESLAGFENHSGRPSSTLTPPLYSLLQAAGGSRHIVFRLLTFQEQVVSVFISLGQFTSTWILKTEKSKTGDQKLEIRSWRSETGDQKLEIRNWRYAMAGCG